MSLAELRVQQDAQHAELRDRFAAIEQRLDRLEARINSMEKELTAVKGKR
jgi:chaperonin cofactor prefoldin